MQELSWKDLQGDEVMKSYAVPADTNGVSFHAWNDAREVVLDINGQSIRMSISGARDLALALRQTANRAERSNPK